MRIFLIGFMACGKSTYAKALAEEGNMKALDLDHLVIKECGMSIPTIFDERGEDFFRKEEEKALKSCAVLDDIVIATGGGTAVFFDNMDFMLSHGISVFLKVPPEKLIERLKNYDTERPLITKQKSLEDFVRSELIKRTVFYRKAHFTIDPLKLSPQLFMEFLSGRKGI